MMIDDDLQLTCPHCLSKLGIDDAGDLTLLDAAPDADNERRGLGGMKVIEASPDWSKHAALSNMQLEPKNQTEVGAAPILGQPKQPISLPDPAVDAANSNDLKERGLNS
jgi:hypothetical protein